MGKYASVVVIALLILAAVFAWRIWDPSTPLPGEEIVIIEAGYQHPKINLSVIPESAVGGLEVAIQPGIKFCLERSGGQIELTLEEWEWAQEYMLTISLPPQDELTLNAPFKYSFVTPPEPAFDLVAVGDVMLDQLTRDRIRDYDVNYPFAKIKQITGSGDLNFANLECPISERGEPADKKYVFRAPTYTAEVLTLGGFNLISLANNHVLDYGPEALQDTIALLEEMGIAHAGASADKERARAGVVLDVNGLGVGFLAYTRPAPSWQYPAWAATVNRPGTIFYRDREQMLEDLARIQLEADVVIVSMHWGEEYTHKVAAEQKELGRLLVDNGADLILGHHPHAPQGIEFYHGKPIVYSLGNFLFYPFEMGITDESYILKARIGPRGVEAMSLVPVLLGNSQPYIPKDSQLVRLQGVLGGLLEQFGTEFTVQGEELVITIP